MDRGRIDVWQVEDAQAYINKQTCIDKENEQLSIAPQKHINSTKDKSSW